jgi:hypothetical protein
MLEGANINDDLTIEETGIRDEEFWKIVWKRTDGAAEEDGRKQEGKEQKWHSRLGLPKVPAVSSSMARSSTTDSIYATQAFVADASKRDANECNPTVGGEAHIPR